MLFDVLSLGRCILGRLPDCILRSESVVKEETRQLIGDTSARVYAFVNKHTMGISSLVFTPHLSTPTHKSTWDSTFSSQESVKSAPLVYETWPRHISSRYVKMQRMEVLREGLTVIVV